MNAQQANAIPMSEILHRLGHEPKKRRGRDVWYLSPLRKEKTASFHIHEGKNIWYDFGAVRGGTVVDFVCAYLESQGEDDTVADALRWLKVMFSHTLAATAAAKCDAAEEQPALRVSKASVLEDFSLKCYLESRGINPNTAKLYLKELQVKHGKSGKNIHVLAMRNVNDGYELRNRFFKGSIAPKAISVIRGKAVLPDEVHIFEGFMDFLSALCCQGASGLGGDVIILNSVALLPQAMPYIENYSYRRVYTWLDNDDAGRKCVQELKGHLASSPQMVVKTMNRVYEKHKDVNAWHMHRLGLN